MQHLGHALEPRGQVHDRPEDRHLHLVDRADLARHGPAGGDADADAKIGQRIVGPLAVAANSARIASAARQARTAASGCGSGQPQKPIAASP